MKNLITITSLLAVGTLLANAATETENPSILLTLPKSGKAEYTGAQTFSVETYKNKDLDTIWLSSNNSGLANYPQNGEGTWVNSSNSGTITFCGRGWASGDHLALLLGSDITVGTELASLTLSAGAISDEAYVSSYRLKLGLLDANGNFLGTTDFAFQDYNTNTDSASVTIVFEEAIKWESGYKILAGVVANGNSSGSNTDSYTISGITASYTAAIPEPSAFGLLAGLGALALAGTRRRRRKA
ncbi:PEP-CTERM sorting domain-containing protein [Candidatus Spyradosoma sp. SGI.093]|uniref:PEP-CTERM sorting domain-containing protein n=1 Tax=Candidatus Spyradosoma sp. SGI.093 TaxID=3420583 RepID=UPI003D052609